MIEQTLERIAAALEKIAGIDPPVLLKQIPAATMTATEVRARQEETAPTAEETTAGVVTTKRSRQEIKEKLDNMGIQYNDRLRTENLEKILEDAEKKGPVPITDMPPAKDWAKAEGPAADDPFGEKPKAAAPAQAPVVEKVKEYTVEEAIVIAKRLAAKFGADKTVPIINSYGVTKISDIHAKGKLQEFVAKVLEKEKEYEKK